MLRFALLLLTVAIQSGLSYRSVCYYTNWAQYRNGKGKYLPSNVDPNLCTHIIYAFAKIQGTDLVAYEWNDESTAWSKGMYERIMEAKNTNPNLKIMLGVGGWNMASAPFSNIAGSDANRKAFAKSVVSFLRKHNFDGLDNDWEYPANRGSPPADKNNNVLMMQEIRRAMDDDAASTGKPRLLLSEAVSVGKDTIDTGYDIPRLSGLVDFFNVMSYDIHGSFEKETGHNSPLFANTIDQGDDRHLNVDWALHYYISKGMPKEKINMGIPTYGRSFTLDGSNDVVGAAAGNAGREGHYTGEKGFISYYEICEKIQSGGQVHNIPSQHVKYLVDGNQWIGYDDVSTVTEKACYAKQLGIGGVMYWALDLDDFEGSTCGEGRYPLINAANKEFQSPDRSHCPNNNPGTNPGPQVTNPPVTYQPLVTNPPITYRPPVTNPPVTYRPPVTYQPVTYRPPVTNPPVTYRPQVTNQQVWTNPPQHLPQTNVGAFNCQGKVNDFYPDPNSCDGYYICAQSQAFKVDCAQGLMYNAQKKHCDWASNVQCGLQTLPPARTYGPFIQQTVGPTRPPVTSAPVTAAPVTPAPITRAPVTNAPVTFAPITAAPVTAAPVTAAPVTAAPVTSAPVTAAPVTNAPNNGFSCKTAGDGIFPANNCRQYIQCVSGHQFKMTCPNKLLFNPALGSCDFPLNVPSCFSG